jgi:hypothetical protein
MSSWAIWVAVAVAAAGSLSPHDLETIVTVLERDRTELGAWHWTVTTEIRVAGEPARIERQRASLDDRSSVHRIAMGEVTDSEGRPAKLSRKLASTVAALQDLAASYAYPEPRELRQALASAHAWPDDEGVELRIQARNVLRRGDALDLIVEARDKHLVRCSVLTSLEGEPVRLEVRFARAAEGPLLPVVAELTTELGERKLTLHAETSGLERR